MKRIILSIDGGGVRGLLSTRVFQHIEQTLREQNKLADKGVAGFDYASLPTPQLHIHHEQDACPGTPYSAVKAYAQGNLVTVRGGIAQGDPCGSGHLHSFEGRDAEVAQTIASWVLRRQVEPVIGQP